MSTIGSFERFSSINLDSNAPAGTPHIAGGCKLVGECANLADALVADEVFDADEFTVDPKGRRTLGAQGSLRRGQARNAIIETNGHDTGIKSRASPTCADFPKILSR